MISVSQNNEIYNTDNRVLLNISAIGKHNGWGYSITNSDMRLFNLKYGYNENLGEKELYNTAIKKGFRVIKNDFNLNKKVHIISPNPSQVYKVIKNDFKSVILSKYSHSTSNGYMKYILNAGIESDNNFELNKYNIPNNPIVRTDMSMNKDRISYGCVIMNSSKNVIFDIFGGYKQIDETPKTIGAEYWGVISSINRIKSNHPNIKNIILQCDNIDVVEKLSEDCIYDTLDIDYEWIPRDNNKLADSLAYIIANQDGFYVNRATELAKFDNLNL